MNGRFTFLILPPFVNLQPAVVSLLLTALTVCVAIHRIKAHQHDEDRISRHGPIRGPEVYQAQLPIVLDQQEATFLCSLADHHRAKAHKFFVWSKNRLLTLHRRPFILVSMLVVRKNERHRAPRLRKPEQTRDRLLRAAFREVFKRGFQSSGIDTILASTNVTKGALYYHFESKEALGYAVIEEIIAKLTSDWWLVPLQRSEDKDPIDTLIGIVRALPNRPKDVKRGCALANLAQEMSQLDEQFRKRLERIFHGWQEGIAMTLRRGQSQGVVRRDLHPEDAASFLIAMIEGYQVLAKNAQDAKVWNMGIRNIVGWLNSLRAPGNGKRA